MNAIPRCLPIRTWLLLTAVAILVVPQLATGLAWDVEQRTPTLAVHDKLVRDVEANVANWSDPAWQASVQSRLAASHLNMALQDSTGRFVFLTAPMSVPGLKFSLALRRETATALLITSSPSLPTGGPSDVVVPSPPRGTVKYVSAPQKVIDVLGPSLGQVPVPYAGAKTAAEVATPVTLSMTTAEVRDAQGQINRIYFWAPEDPTLMRLRSLLLPVSWLAALLLNLVVVAWFVGRAILRPLAAMSQAARNIATGDLEFQVPDSGVREVAEVGTAFRAMGEALGASICQQAQMEQERRLFVSAIAHDLRTPLFSLRGYLEGLEKGVADSPERRAKYVAVCQEKAAALDRLVSDLFAYAQVEYLEQAPGRETLELGALLRQTVEGVRPLAAAKDVALVLDRDLEPGSAVPAAATLAASFRDGTSPVATESVVGGPSESGVFVGDDHLLTRTIENLLDNALRHTPAGGVIRVGWHREGDRLAFSVRDTGPGFEPRDLPRVFTPLFRSETSRNRQTGGAGLGLTIARRLLLAHGGDLTAANAPDGGALLTGYLPAADTETDSTHDSAHRGSTDHAVQ